MTIDPEILASEASDRARPFSVYLQTDAFAGGFRFDTEIEAIHYIAAQSLNYLKNRFSTWRAELTGPNGKRTFDYVDIADGLSG